MSGILDALDALEVTSPTSYMWLGHRTELPEHILELAPPGCGAAPWCRASGGGSTTTSYRSARPVRPGAAGRGRGGVSPSNWRRRMPAAAGSTTAGRSSAITGRASSWSAAACDCGWRSTSSGCPAAPAISSLGQSSRSGSPTTHRSWPRGATWRSVIGDSTLPDRRCSTGSTCTYDARGRSRSCVSPPNG